MKRELSGSEAVCGFCAWLTTRDEVTTMSANNDSAVIAQLIDLFCKTNELTEPTDDWTDFLTHPK